MLHYETVTPYIRNTLSRLMADPNSFSFRPADGHSTPNRFCFRIPQCQSMFFPIFNSLFFI